VKVARPATTDKIVFLIFMPQFSSAQAASQETLGSGRRDDLATVRIVNFFAQSEDTGLNMCDPQRIQACAGVTALSQ
jgi:hypothetical protein